MRINCPHCGSKMRITHTNSVSNEVSDLYADCTNQKCAARSLFILSHSHDITPPQPLLTDAMAEIIANMDPQTRKDLVRQYAT